MQCKVFMFLGVVTGTVLLAARPWYRSAAQERIPAPPPATISPPTTTTATTTTTTMSTRCPTWCPTSRPGGENSMGVGSCAAPACHGGPTTEPAKWKSAYTVWIEQDKHAHAGIVLYEDRSKDILRGLDRLAKDADVKPWRDTRCLACHAAANPGGEGGSALASDGVGCEACHGAAKTWIDAHTSRTWSQMPDRYRNSHVETSGRDGRMINTKDVKVRAQVCVDCHIGSVGDDGRPARNMNHDMIAAGHPRLAFEYSAFLANMPHHWSDRSTSGDGPPPTMRTWFPVWAVGQAVSTQAALRLLAARAKEAQIDPAKAPWPEFSEYDCYSCHHAITPGSYHRKYMKAAEKNGVRPGSYAWGRWYLPMTERLLRDGVVLTAGEHPGTQHAEIDDLLRIMAHPVPPPGEVAAKATAAANHLEPLAAAVEKSSFPPAAVQRLLEGSKAEEGSPANWDEACAVYLLYRSAYGSDPGLRPALLAVRKTLEFSSGPVSLPTEVPARWNSPRDFDPARFSAAMKELRERLPSTQR